MNENFNLFLGFVGLMLALYVHMLAAQDLFRAVYWGLRPDNIARSAWILLELFFQFSIVLSNAAFLLLRSFGTVKPSNDKHLDQSVCIADSDTLTSKSFLLNCWNIEVSTMFLAMLLGSTGIFTPWPPLPDTVPALVVICCSVSFGAICAPFFILVPWQTGPRWWTSCAPYLYMALLISIYLVVPLVNIVYAAVLIPELQ